MRSVSQGTNRRTIYVLCSLLMTLCLFVALAALAKSASAQTSARQQAQGDITAPKAGGTMQASPDCAPGWNIVQSNNQGTDDNFFNGIQAISDTNVWAIGAYRDTTLGGVDQTLIEHWDGSSWIQVLSPDQSTSDNYLDGIAAISAGNVWAVGGYSPSPTDPTRTLIVHWNGNAWTAIPSDNSGTRTNSLLAVSGDANNDVWAVGSYAIDANLTLNTLTEHWNGSTWQVQPSLDRGTSYNQLYAVDAIANDNVWTVGYSTNSAGLEETLIEHWTGSAWNIVPSYNEAGNRNILTGISAISANDIWAVGYYYAAPIGSPSRVLIEHWDGSTWSNVANPAFTTNTYRLSGVQAIAADDVWASGSFRDAANNNRTLIEHWDGTAWNVEFSPDYNVTSSFLGSLSAVSSGDIWAAGFYNNGTADRTLTERFNPCPASCPTEFQDVPPGNTFYQPVKTMACNNIIGGYTCGGPGEPCLPGDLPYFRPNNNVTRGQIAKIVALSAGIKGAVSGQIFQDVAPGSTYYTYTEQLTLLGVMSGYACGGPGEPCVAPGDRPYFRPNSTATRGQLAKIDSNTAHYVDTPSGQLFQDVAPSSTYYTFIQRLAMRGIMGGYACGGPGEPCGPTHLPYFRPNNDVTRGQTSKIVGNTFFP